MGQEVQKNLHQRTTTLNVHSINMLKVGSVSFPFKYRSKHIAYEFILSIGKIHMMIFIKLILLIVCNV